MTDLKKATKEELQAEMDRRTTLATQMDIADKIADIAGHGISGNIVSIWKGALLYKSIDKNNPDMTRYVTYLVRTNIKKIEDD